MLPLWLSARMPVPLYFKGLASVLPALLLATTPLIVTALEPLMRSDRATVSLSDRKTLPLIVAPPVLLTVNVRLFEPELVKLPLNVTALLPLSVVFPPRTTLLARVRAPPPA